MKYLVKTEESADGSGVACGWIDLDESLIDLIKRRSKMFEGLSEKDDDIYHLVFSDHHCRFIRSGRDSNKVPEDDLDELFHTNIEPTDYEPRETEVANVHFSRMFVDEEYVWWEGEPKHTSVSVNTVMIDIDELEEMLKGKR